MANASFLGQMQKGVTGISHYFPLGGSPALKADGYNPNVSLIVARTVSGVALSCIAMAGLFWAFPAAAIFAAKYEALSLLGTAIASTIIPLFIEAKRASNAADQKALTEYRNPIPSAKAVKYISRKAEVFQQILKGKGNIYKMDEKGKTLVQRIFEFSWGDRSQVRRLLVDGNVDLLALDETGVSPFMHGLKAVDVEFLEHALKSKKVEPHKIDERAQAAIWKHVNSPKVVQLFCKYGFSINAKDEEGRTPLMHWVEKEGTSLVAAALNERADLSLRDNQEREALDWVPEDRPCIVEMIQQADRTKRGPCPSPIERQSFLSWLPWKPFVLKGSSSYEVDAAKITTCISLAAIGMMGSLYFVPISLYGVAAKVISVASAFILPFSIIETIRGKKEADRQAVYEYLKKPVPSVQATGRIQRSISAAEMLTQHGDLSSLEKLNEWGSPLLDAWGVNSKVAALLIEKGVNPLKGPFLDNFLGNSNEPETAARILELIREKFGEIPVERQMKIWGRVRSKQIALVLKNQGFNPNIQDEEENTPLMILVNRNHPSKAPFFDIKGVTALLAAGADPNIANKQGQTAKDLATEPVVRKCLENWSAG